MSPEMSPRARRRLPRSRCTGCARRVYRGLLLRLGGERLCPRCVTAELGKLREPAA